MLTIGFTLYALSLGLTAWLLMRLIAGRHYDDFPVFTGYIAVVVLKSSIGFILKNTASTLVYFTYYRCTRPIMYALVAAIAAEALRHAYRNAKLERGVQFAAALPVLALTANFSFNLDAVLRAGLALVCFAVVPKMKQTPTRAIGVLLGTFAMELLPAIAGRAHFLAASPAASYATTFGYSLAIAVWLTYFPKSPAASLPARAC